MDIFKIAEILLYDMEKFSYYWQYRNEYSNSYYLSFEEFLLCEDNLNEYLINPMKILNKYKDYHKKHNIEFYECFEMYCKKLYTLPFDENKLKDKRSCYNCFYYDHYINLKDNTEYDACSNEEAVFVREYCDYHKFDVDKISPISRTYSR